LAIIGLGGAIPGYRVENGKFIEFWPGYPYLTENSDQADLLDTYEKARSKFGDIQYLFLTHTGPYESPTTVWHWDDKIGDVYGGSKSINELLKKDAYKILANIHGHLHLSEGMVKLFSEKQAIINPGAAKYGKFAELTLIKLKNEWIIQSVKFIDISQ